MENKDISLYPKLADNIFIKELVTEIAQKNKELQGLERTLIIRIGQEQASCPHAEFKENLVFDKNLNSSSYSRGINVLVSKTCKACGHVEKPSSSNEEKICCRCWSPMEFQGKTPGQGGDGWCVYKCTNPKCNGEIWNT